MRVKRGVKESGDGTGEGGGLWKTARGDARWWWTRGPRECAGGGGVEDGGREREGGKGARPGQVRQGRPGRVEVTQEHGMERMQQQQHGGRCWVVTTSGRVGRGASGSGGGW